MSTKLLSRLGGGSRSEKGKRGRAKGEKGPRAAGSDAIALLIRYVKQETLGPLQGLGRYLAVGIGGSVLLALGVLLLLVALLRALQTETGTTFAGNLSWLPYLVVAVAALLVMAFAIWRIARGPAARKIPSGGSSGDKPADAVGVSTRNGE